MHYTDKLLDIVCEGIFTAKNKPKAYNIEQTPKYQSIYKDVENDIVYYPRSVVITHTKRALDQGRPVIIPGMPGVSKSVSLQQVAKERAAKIGRTFKEWTDFSVEELERLVDPKNPQAAEERAKYYILIEVRTNAMAPEDMTGIPDIMNNLEYTKYRPQLWLHYATLSDTAGCLFFDEINQGSDAVLKGLMQLFLDKRIGYHKLNNQNGNWDITGAGNFESNAANTVLVPALRQRAAIIGMGMSSREWRAYAESMEFDPVLIRFVASGFRKTPEGGETNRYLIAPPETEMDGGVSPRSIAFFDKAFKQLQKEAEESGKSLDLGDVKLTAEEYLTPSWAEDFALYLQSFNTFNYEKFEKDSDIAVKDPGAFLKQSRSEIKNKAEAAADEIMKRHFTRDGKKQIQLLYGVMEDLYTDSVNIMREYISNTPADKKLTSEQRQLIKTFIEFFKLLKDSGNGEVIAILINMFLSTPDGKSNKEGMDIIASILSVLNEKNQLEFYKPIFMSNFKHGNRLKDGRVDEIEFEESEESSGEQLFNSSELNKLMNIKQKLDQLGSSTSRYMQ